MGQADGERIAGVRLGGVIMNKTVFRAIAVAAAFAAVPAAQAASVINPNGINGSARLESGFPLDFTVQYDGWGGDPSAHALLGLSALIDFRFLGAVDSGKSFKFAYTLRNTSSAGSQLRAFGFDIDPTTGLSVTVGAGDLFDLPKLNPNGTVPSEFGGVDFCLKIDGNQNNCNSGQTGVLSGALAQGTFNLNYASAPPAVTLDRFFVRYQAVSGLAWPDQNVSSAIGRGTVITPIPEPTTWALMIAGFGLVGGALRLRRARQTLVDARQRIRWAAI